MQLDMNPQFIRALELMEKPDRHLFITGKAGTGKSTLLEYFRTHTKKNVAVVAPTGVAAVNVRGQTIHSFCGFKPDITSDRVQKADSRTAALLKKIDTIIIDEISMVRADLLDCVDQFLRLNGHDKYRPFGGIQMIFIGDLFQLPPVVTERDREVLGEKYLSPYFFDANVFACLTLDVIELGTIYRQQDDQFIDILNAIRANVPTYDQLATLNQQWQAEYPDGAVITLATTNALADNVNAMQLSKLPGTGINYIGQRSGAFGERDAPAPVELTLKVGAQVMLLNNDAAKRWVNGTLGAIVEIRQFDDLTVPDEIIVQLENGQKHTVLPHTWETHEFVLDPETESVTTRTAGSYTQYPLKLAWAVTIHKSQGKTFDKVVIDIGRGTFAHGQLYVALSRCRSLEGIRLKQPIHRRHIMMDKRVLTFMTQFSDRSVFRGADAIDEVQRLF